MSAPTRNPVRLAPRDGHLGLQFYKYVDTWSDNWALAPNARQEFLTKIVDTNENLRRAGGYGASLLEAIRCRQDRCAAAMADQGHIVTRRTFTTSWRLVTGLGISHPLETGFLFHHTWGVPYLPGSGVKGAASAWLEENKPAIWNAQKTALFGQPQRDQPSVGGHVIFFDAFPTNWPKIEIDIMNPHYGEYYTGTQPPADWLMPNPIHFLAIAPGQPFEFTVAVRHDGAGHETSDAQSLLSLALEALAGAATMGGLGGKSAVGYGYFQ
jgi:CRISPR-associated protein Cmr6